MSASTSWAEQTTPNEAAELEKLAEVIHQIQLRRAAKRAPARGLHVKANAGVKGEFTVLDGLPDHARAGLFAKPATYRAYVRFSNGGPARQADRRPDARGIAVKVIGVNGKKIIKGLEDARTQDFLGITAPVVPFTGPHDFVWFASEARKPLTFLPKAFARFGVVNTVKLIRRSLAFINRPMSSCATSTYFSGAPIACGAYAVRYSFAPSTGAAPEAKRASPEYLREDLVRRLAQGPLEWHLRLQFFTDEPTTPIEDAAVEWPTPWVTVARLTLPSQQLESPEGLALAEKIERCSFDPWHGLEAHRPLGAMMRARAVAYRVSVLERQAAAEPE